ncbi:MAG: putative glycoside hydrolase [Candidatus Paceibacterota bacterium]
MEQQGIGKSGIIAIVIVVFIATGYGWHLYSRTNTAAIVPANQIQSESIATTQTADIVPMTVTPPVSHIETPSQVNAIYISSWSAGTPSSMAHLNTLLDGGKVNAVVVDIKDATGRLSYIPQDPTLAASGVGTKRIAHLDTLIKSLHDKDIYVIGRIAVFQDPYWPTIHPEDALQDTTTGKPWKDKKGLTWLRADNPKVWSYIESVAEDAYAQGFDEVNMDYVRFPTDGALKNIDTSTFTKPKQDIIAEFFAHLDTTLRQKDHIPLSADVFGLTVSAKDDMGIGQKLELIAAHVDYICPMIYPSHFASGSYGFKNPADHPYDVISKALLDGNATLTAANISTTKLRPWLQDFNLGAIYTPAMVQAQITATDDVGIKSWLMWDASNQYTSSVYK